MNKLRGFNKLTLALAVSSALAGKTFAEEDNQESGGGLDLEEVVVTGVAKAVTKIETSVSVSSVDYEDVGKFSSRSIAEVYRSIPGLRSEPATGAGNGSISVRGIPLATGGYKFVQIQEDGLPVIQYGDIIAGNAPNYVRGDYTLSRIEAVRGGSASTLTSNSPGAIINHISKTGEEEGGSVGFSYGVDFDEFRTDFDYGAQISDTLRFHVGGFYREGEGVREIGFNANQGSQIKANLTKEFDTGYVRLYYKKLDDRVATYFPQPVVVDGGGGFSPAPGFDGSKESISSRNRTSVGTYDANGNPFVRSTSDHLESIVDSFGFEASFDLGDGWSITNRFRHSDISGGLVGPLLAGAGDFGNALDVAANICGCANPVVTYANGVDAGQPYTGLASGQLELDFVLDDLGFVVNDLRLTKELDALTITAGLYNSSQKIKQNWSSWQFYFVEQSGNNAASLNVVDGDTGTAYTGPGGAYNYGVFNRIVDLEYETVAPYFDINWEIENFSINTSVRRDMVEVSGIAANGGTQVPTDVNNDGDVTDPFDSISVVDINTGQAHDYEPEYTSYSIGGNWAINENQGVFARYSKGGVVIADRLFDRGAGEVQAANQGLLDGYDEVKQFEIGYKLTTDNFDLFLTAFDSETEETQSEVTTGETFSRVNEAYGLEIEAAYHIGNFHFSGNLTWTDAEIASDDDNPSVVGNTPSRQADYIFTLTPEYGTENFSIGASFVGSGDAPLGNNEDSDLTQDAYILVHLFGNYYVTDALSVSLNVNNLTDEFVVSIAQENLASNGNLVNGDLIVAGETLNGRSATLSLKYDF